MSDRTRGFERRRTFAIISHPDAGKTTLTEKLLLYAGAIHLAGSIKARKAARHATSDWLALERERGISITSSVLQFEYEGYQVNLLDTPGHVDFSEDTYRALLAADSAVMLLDNRKGVEEQTRKLFRVCRMRRLPLFTFVNKCDRVGEDPLKLLDDVEADLGVRTYPITWPVLEGHTAVGVYDRRSGRVHRFERSGDHGQSRADDRTYALDDPAIGEFVSADALARLREEIEMLDAAGHQFDPEGFRSGEITPTFFGSALLNFGVSLFLEYFLGHAPAPRPWVTPDGAEVNPDDPAFSGFVFKIQANMDPNHRDRIAFVRICSGTYEPGMTVQNVRSDRPVRLASARQFLARDRKEIERALPGDVIGIHDRGNLRIGDTLSENGGTAITEVPRFPPEHFARIRLKDAFRRKQLDLGLRHLAEEGAIQLFHLDYPDSPNAVAAVVGTLQFDVLKHRLEGEYGVEAQLEAAPFTHARWAVGSENEIKRAASGYGCSLAYDLTGRPVILFESAYALQKTLEREDAVELHEVSP